MLPEEMNEMLSTVPARGHRRLTLVALLVAALFAVPLPSGAAEAPSVLRRAALRIAVTTTSDWAQVDLPGVSAGHVVVAGDRTVRPTDRGVVVTGPLRVRGSATVDVVTEVDPAAVQAAITVTQGGVGATSVEVLNRTSDLRRVAEVSTSWSATRVTATLPMDRLMGEAQLPWARADQQKRVLAFTYPWFGDWAETDPRLQVHPTDAWISRSADSALSQARQARAHGIDGFVMSFAGARRHGLPLHHSLDAAEATGGTATALIETPQASSVAEVERWVAEALDQAEHPAFMRVDGVPVLFAFATGTVPATAWQAITARMAAAGTPVSIVTDAWATTSGASAGWYRYNALLQSPTDELTTSELIDWNRTSARRLRATATLGVGEPGIVVATVQPGWERHDASPGEVVIQRDGTATYDRTWVAALAAEPDWVVITSWDEWYEGTGIAPSVEHGTAALEATARWAAAFAG